MKPSSHEQKTQLFERKKQTQDTIALKFEIVYLEYCKGFAICNS